MIHPAQDAFITTADARATFEATPGDDKELIILDRKNTGHGWGHVDVIHGRDAPEYVWKPTLDWLERHVS